MADTDLGVSRGMLPCVSYRSSAASAPTQLPRLTSFRWYAAFGVLLYHLGDALEWPLSHAFTILGALGVSFFYVLSGFVLAWSYRGTAWAFYRRRFARIYPATLVSTVVAAVLLAAGEHWILGGALGAVSSLFLVQAWFPDTYYPVYAYNNVAWSLSCEAFFYLTLPVLLAMSAAWSGRRIVAMSGLVVTAGLGATLIVLVTVHGNTHIYAANLAYHNPLIRLPEFIAGVALGVLVKRGLRPRLPLLPAVLLFGACTYLAARIEVFPLQDYFVLPGTLAILIAGISADTRDIGSWLMSRTSVYLGELSFCFYLVHYLAIRVSADAFGWTGHSFGLLGGLIRAFVCLAVAVAAAALLHHVVELPAQKRLRPRPSVRPEFDSASTEVRAGATLA
jgi:peptidoglycan/LPS O-acetylase OafA/YrhL